MKNKMQWTDAQLKSLALKVAEADKMPIRVATDLLCQVDRRMTNAERKTYLGARQRELLSIRLRKPRSVKLEARMQNASLPQLLQWQRRAGKMRRGLQHRYHALLQLPNDLRVQAMIHAVDTKAGLLDGAIDIMDAERKHRNNLAVGKIDGDLLGVEGVGVFFWKESRWVRTKVPDYASPKYATR